MKVWQRPGPAKALYDHFLQSPSIVESWVDSIRRSWGDPYHPDLLLFPQVERQDLEIANDTGDAVAVTRFVPPEPGGDVMVYIHGGGWIAPVSGKHLAWARKLAAQTAIEVISVNYRLAPEHPFPAALLDCVTVYQAVRESTDGRVYVGGDSAGGNLSAALVQYCRAQRLTIPDKLLCLCPLTDFYLEKYPSVVKKGIGNPRADALLLPFQRICYVRIRRNGRIRWPVRYTVTGRKPAGPWCWSPAMILYRTIISRLLRSYRPMAPTWNWPSTKTCRIRFTPIRSSCRARRNRSTGIWPRFCAASWHGGS